METIAAALEARAYKPADVEKILGGNFRRLVADVIG
jgi:microsomal dipeptidase-like Zn-dependent dipeptidase